METLQHINVLQIWRPSQTGNVYTNPGTRRVSRKQTSDDRWSHIAPYALISLVSFLCGVGLLVLMLWKAEKLVALGLTGNLFYMVLLPLALAAAGFLFGVLRSYASYRGTHLGGVLQLGGPVVLFALVVIGGFVLAPSRATFPITVYVHGERGPQDLVLRDSGRVFLDLDGDRRSEPIGGNGQAYFPAIPANFRGQEVLAWVESHNFEPLGGARKRRLDGASFYVPVRKKSGRVAGRVQDQKGNAVAGAAIRVAGVSTSTDGAGHFELTIPGDRLKPELELYAVAPGYVPEHYTVVPNANEIVVDLRRSRR